MSSFGDPRPAPKPAKIERIRKTRPRAGRRPKADQVPEGLFGELLGRDGGCVAPGVMRSAAYVAEAESAAAAAGIRVEWRGHPCSGRLTVEHVRDAAAMGARRAPSDRRHCVLLCEWHHLRSGWATSHKAELRTYLESVEGREERDRA